MGIEFVDAHASAPWGGVVQRLMGIFAKGNANVMLCGPPGSGKKTAVKVAAIKCGLQVSQVHLDSWVPATLEQEARLMPSGTMLAKRSTVQQACKCVCLLAGLDICQKGQSYDAALKIIKKKSNLVAVVNDPTPFSKFYSDGLGNLIRLKGFTWQAMQGCIDKLPGSKILSTKDKVDLCRSEGATNGNLARLKLATQMLIQAKEMGCTVDGAADAMHHNYFDTMRLVNRERLSTMPPHKVHGDWVASNIIGNLNLEDAARASALVAEINTFDDRDMAEEMLLSYAKQTAVTHRLDRLVQPSSQTEASISFKRLMCNTVYEFGPGDKVEADRRNELVHALHGNGMTGEHQSTTMLAGMKAFEPHWTSMLATGVTDLWNGLSGIVDRLQGREDKQELVEFLQAMLSMGKTDEELRAIDLTQVGLEGLPAYTEPMREIPAAPQPEAVSVHEAAAAPQPEATLVHEAAAAAPQPEATLVHEAPAAPQPETSLVQEALAAPQPGSGTVGDTPTPKRTPKRKAEGSTEPKQARPKAKSQVRSSASSSRAPPLASFFSARSPSTGEEANAEGTQLDASSAGLHGFSVGPPDVPGAQLDLGIEPAPALRNDVLSPSEAAEAVAQAGFESTQVLHVKKGCKQAVVECKLWTGNAGKTQKSQLIYKRGGVRNLKYAVLQAKLPVAELHEFVKQHYAFYCVSATTGGAEALILNAGAQRVQMKAEIQGGSLQGVEFMQALQSMQKAEFFSTLKVNGEKSLAAGKSREEIIAIVAPYTKLNKAEFEAELIAMSTRTDLTENDQLLLSKAAAFRTLRAAMQELELAKSLLVAHDDPRVLQMSDFINLDQLYVYCKHGGTGPWRKRKFLSVVYNSMESITMIFTGKPMRGKTPLCMALLAAYARSRKMPHFAKASTAESLRQLFVQSMFQPCLGILLDEWRIGQSSQDAMGHRVDFIKCLCDVTNPGGVRMRYSDISFCPQMPRLITSQMSKEQWVCAMAGEALADREAVLKRVWFIEVNVELVPESLVVAAEEGREESMREAFKAIGLECTVDDGIWDEVSEQQEALEQEAEEPEAEEQVSDGSEPEEAE